MFMNGIHSEPKSRWIEEVMKNEERIRNMPNMADRRRALEEIASTIIGIGPTTIDNTLAQFEIEHYD